MDPIAEHAPLTATDWQVLPPVKTNSASRRRLRRLPRRRLRTLADLDRRSLAAKRAQALVCALEKDLGVDASASQRQLIQRAALLATIAEDSEVRWLMQEPVDVATYVSVTRAQHSILCSLGLQRVPIDVTRRAQELEDREAGLIE
jgi:hypothetical protein